MPKDDVRIEAYGTVDELNAVLGLARAQGLDAAADALVAQLQDELFVVGSALADPSPGGPVSQRDHRRARRASRSHDRRARNRAGAAHPVHPAGRHACRRAHPPGPHRLPPRRAADRQAVASAGRRRSRSLIVYLNRLSDLLFVLARAVNHRAGVADILWKGM